MDIPIPRAPSTLSLIAYSAEARFLIEENDSSVVNRNTAEVESGGARPNRRKLQSLSAADKTDNNGAAARILTAPARH